MKQLVTMLLGWAAIGLSPAAAQEAVLSTPDAQSLALGGAALLTVCDVAARLLFAPYELPVGIVLSFAGGPFFLWLLIRKRGRHL